MKVFISCDMEGLTGIIKKDQISPPGNDYERARKLMTWEINAAARGAFKKGAKRVIVNDAHGKMDNILIEELEPGIELISGHIKPFNMMEGIWGDFNLAFFLGYHSMKDNNGVLSHTYSGPVIQNIKINDMNMGETGINAILAGHFGVPVGLISGDDILIDEAKKIFGEDSTRFVTCKWSLSKFSAWSKSLNEVYQELEDNAAAAVDNANSLTPIESPSPLKLELTFTEPVYAEQALLQSGSKSVEGDISSPVVIYEAKDVVEAYRAFRTMLILANSIV